MEDEFWVMSKYTEEQIKFISGPETIITKFL